MVSVNPRSWSGFVEFFQSRSHWILGSAISINGDHRPRHLQHLVAVPSDPIQMQLLWYSMHWHPIPKIIWRMFIPSNPHQSLLDYFSPSTWISRTSREFANSWLGPWQSLRLVWSLEIHICTLWALITISLMASPSPFETSHQFVMGSKRRGAQLS